MEQSYHTCFSIERGVYFGVFNFSFISGLGQIPWFRGEVEDKGVCSDVSDTAAIQASKAFFDGCLRQEISNIRVIRLSKGDGVFLLAAESARNSNPQQCLLIQLRQTLVYKWQLLFPFLWALFSLAERIPMEQKMSNGS